MAIYRANFRKGGEERRNSLGLDSERLNRLLDIIDNGAETDANLKRTHVRWPFRSDSLVFRLIEGMGGRREFKVAARNLSNSGISLIHNAYVHPGMDCEVCLPQAAGSGSGVGGATTVKGSVTRCRHVQGIVHEIGVRFESEIDARPFLSRDPVSAYFSRERINPDAMEGTVLHIDDSALDRRLFAHYLEDTRVIVRAADTIEQAKDTIKDSYDVIVMDQRLPDGRGSDLVAWMRDNGILTPVIMLTADASAETRQEVAGAEINGLFTKPADKDNLLRAIAEFLGMGEDSAKRAAGDSMSDIAGVFVAELGGIIDDLRAAMDKADATTAYSIALRLKGTAPALGFDRLAAVSDKAATALAANMSCPEASREIDALLDACERLRHRRAA